MSETEQTAAPTPEAGPSIEEIAAQVFGADAPPVALTEAPKEEPAKVDPPKDPAAEKVAARLTVALKAEERAARSRAEIAAAKAEIETSRAEVAEHLKVVEALKAAKTSPSKALELLGMTPKEFLEKLATEHEPAAVAARAVKGTSDEVAKLQAKIAAMEKAATDREEASRKRALDTEYDQATAGFLEEVAKEHANYPTLVREYSDAEIARAAQSCLDEVVGKDDAGKPVTRLEAFVAEHRGRPEGPHPTNKEIAEFLEYRAQERSKNRGAWHQRIGLNGAKPSEGAVTSSGDLQVAQPATGPSPRTLTSRAASEKATTAKPWSQEWADEESMRILHAALKTG